MSEGTTHGYVHEKQSQRGVAERGRGLEVVELLSQQNGSQGHGGGLGDEGAQQRRNAQYRQPPGSRGALAQRGAELQRVLCQAINRAGGCNHHHHRHKQRLGKAGVVVDIEQEVLHRVIGVAHQCKGYNPQAEHYFHLAQEMAEGGGKGYGHTLFGVQYAELLLLEFLLVSVLELVSE